MRPGPCQPPQPHVTPLSPALSAGLRLFTNSYLLIVHQTPALCQELNTGQGTEEAGPRPQPACTHLPLGSHGGVLQPLHHGNLLRPRASHPSPCQQYHVPLFETMVQGCNFSCFCVIHLTARFFQEMMKSASIWWWGGAGSRSPPPPPSPSPLLS